MTAPDLRPRTVAATARRAVERRVRRSRRGALAVAGATLAAGVGLAAALPAGAATAQWDGPNHVTIASDTIKGDGVDGVMTLSLFADGTYTVNAHVHNGNWGAQNYAFGCALKSSSGGVHAFATSGLIGGRGVISRGGSKYRNPNGSGVKQDVASDWRGIQGGGNLSCKMTAKYDVKGLFKDLGEYVGTTAAAVGAVAAIF